MTALSTGTWRSARPPKSMYPEAPRRPGAVIELIRPATVPGEIATACGPELSSLAEAMNVSAAS